MTAVNFIVVYLVCWWLVLFMVLPWGVIGRHEAGGNYEESKETSFSVKTNYGRKMLITTAITTVIWGMFWAVMEWELISIN